MTLRPLSVMILEALSSQVSDLETGEPSKIMTLRALSPHFPRTYAHAPDAQNAGNGGKCHVS